MIYTIQNGKLVKSVAKSGKKYETQSSRRRKRKRERNANARRNQRIYKFYESTKWQHKSRQVRKREPLCRQCVREFKRGKRPLTKIHLATSVDHIEPLKTKDGWRNRLNNSNLQPLCTKHHAYKSKILKR